MATYNAVMRPALEYASSIWSPLAFSTRTNNLQGMAMCMSTPINQLFNDESIAVQIIFFWILYVELAMDSIGTQD